MTHAAENRQDTVTITNPEQIEKIFNDPTLMVRPAAEAIPSPIEGTRAGEIFGNLARWNDGERHEVRRRVVETVIGSLDPGAVAHHARVASVRLCDSAPDLHSWMINVAPYALGSVIGFDDDALPEIARATSAFTRAISPAASADQVTAGIAAADVLWDFTTALDTYGADKALITANRIGLLFQSFDSTSGLLGNALIYLHQHPDVTDARTAIRHAVHETPSIRNTRRYVSEQVPTDGSIYGNGSEIILDLEGATIERQGGPSLAFGAGVHQCPGQVIAFTLAAAAIEAGPRLRDLPAAGLRYLPYPNAQVPDFRGVPLSTPPVP